MNPARVDTQFEKLTLNESKSLQSMLTQEQMIQMSQRVDLFGQLRNKKLLLKTERSANQSQEDQAVQQIHRFAWNPYQNQRISLQQQYQKQQQQYHQRHHSFKRDIIKISENSFQINPQSQKNIVRGLGNVLRRTESADAHNRSQNQFKLAEINRCFQKPIDLIKLKQWSPTTPSTKESLDCTPIHLSTHKDSQDNLSYPQSRWLTQKGDYRYQQRIKSSRFQFEGRVQSACQLKIPKTDQSPQKSKTAMRQVRQKLFQVSFGKTRVQSTQTIDGNQILPPAINKQCQMKVKIISLDFKNQNDATQDTSNQSCSHCLYQIDRLLRQNKITYQQYEKLSGVMSSLHVYNQCIKQKRLCATKTSPPGGRLNEIWGGCLRDFGGGDNWGMSQ